MNEALFFFTFFFIKIVPLLFNTLILVRFLLVKASMKFLFLYVNLLCHISFNIFHIFKS